MSRGKQIRPRTRARRRADRTTSDQWSVVKAAAALVHKRDEVLARSSENPLTIAMAQADLTDTLDRYEQRFTDRGCNPDTARLLALTTLTHSSGLSPSDPDLIERLERRQRSTQLEPLRAGEAYVISPAMHATVAAAAHTLTNDNLAGWRSDSLLAERGVLLLPHIQLVQVDGKPVPDEIVMLSWGTGRWVAPLGGPAGKVLYLSAWFDAHGPVEVPLFTAARTVAARSGHPLPRLGVAGNRRCALDLSSEEIASAGGGRQLADAVIGVAGEQHASSASVGEYSGEVIDVVDLGEWAQRYLFAFMGLAQQRVATVQRLRELRADTAKPLRHDDVRVVRLRSGAPVGEDARAQSARRYRHRWTVRMHKVNQWYPCEGVHKVIWRGPYIKGPADAPLLAGEKVYALVR